MVRAILPVANKPYDNAAEYLLTIPFALVLVYWFLWKRTSVLEAQYAALEKTPRRWLVAVSFLLSCAFALACGYGRVNFWGSILVATSILLFQEWFYRHLERRVRTHIST